MLSGVSEAGVIESAYGDFARSGMPGCNVAVLRDGKAVERGSFGLADVANSVPLSAATRFDIGSMSKQFTALLVLQLAARGKIDLKADVHRYLPEIPRYRWPVTVGDLLHHSSGIRDYGALLQLAGWVYGDLITERDAIWAIDSQPALNFEPNTQEEYSDSNYVLLARIVERVTNQAFGTYLRSTIFDRLGMNDTTLPATHNEIIPNEARAYGLHMGRPYILQNAIETYGDGQVVSTVDDFAKWEANFDSGTVGVNVLRSMTSTSQLADGDVNNYAGGLEVKTYRGLEMIQHDGANGGFVSDAIRFPSLHLAVIELCNRRDGSIFQRILRVADAYIDARLGTPMPSPSPVPSDVVLHHAPSLRAFTGPYLRPDKTDSFLFGVQGGSLVDENGTPYRRIGSTVFQDAEGATYRFALSGDAATALYEKLPQGRNWAKYVRMPPPQLDARTLRGFAGAYVNAPLASIWCLTASGSHLTLERKGFANETVLPIWRDAFVMAGVEALFERHAGIVSGLTVLGERVSGIRFTRDPSAKTLCSISAKRSTG